MLFFFFSSASLFITIFGIQIPLKRVVLKLGLTAVSLFCVDALKQALTKGSPEIFTDQGAQFTFDRSL
jgi:hypothetical protein